MDVLGALLVLLSFVVFLGGVIWLIVALIRRQARRIPLLTILAGPVLFIVGVIFLVAFDSGDDSSSPSVAGSKRSIVEPTAVPSPTPAPSPTATPIPSGETRSEPAPMAIQPLIQV